MGNNTIFGNGYKMYMIGDRTASARLDNPIHRPNGAPRTVPTSIASTIRQRLTPKAGNIDDALSANSGITLEGCGSAGESTARANSHHIAMTAIVPQI